MVQTENGCDTSQAEYQSSMPRYLFLRIAAVTALVVAVRVAVAAAMTLGVGVGGAPPAELEAPLVEERPSLAELRPPATE